MGGGGTTTGGHLYGYGEMGGGKIKKTGWAGIVENGRHKK
jgi:hypothetical protein